MKPAKKKLETVEYEGLLIAPKAGVYRCPYECGDKNYPAPKWKTEKGFLKHLDGCYMKPEKVAQRKKISGERARIDVIKKAEKEEVAKDMVNKCLRKIGDYIHYVECVEVKPTHEQRGTRLVKVRYEPVLKHYPRTTTIKRIQWGAGYVYNGDIRERDIMGSEQESKAVASKRTGEDEDYRNECKMLR